MDNSDYEWLADARSARSQLSVDFQHEIWPLKDELYRAARRMTHSHADAEDLLQDTLTRAFVGFHRFDHAHPKAWLLTIMRNSLINGHRSRSRRPLEVLTDEIVEAADSASRNFGGSQSAESVALSRLPSASTVTAFRGLSEPAQAVLYYADIEGFRYAEIADILGIPLGTVMSRIHRSRARLRQLLAEEDDAA